jgi:hypothetical protein
MAAHSCWPRSASVLPPPRRGRRRIEPLPLPFAHPLLPGLSGVFPQPLSPSPPRSPTPPVNPWFPHGLRRRRLGGRRQRRDRGLRRPLQLRRRRREQALRPPDRRRRERSVVLPSNFMAVRLARSDWIAMPSDGVLDYITCRVRAQQK